MVSSSCVDFTLIGKFMLDLVNYYMYLLCFGISFLANEVLYFHVCTTCYKQHFGRGEYDVAARFKYITYLGE